MRPQLRPVKWAAVSAIYIAAGLTSAQAGRMNIPGTRLIVPLLCGLLFVTGVNLFAATPVISPIQTFKIESMVNNCSVPFISSEFQWSNRKRIWIMRGDKIRITLYGVGANLATDATGWAIREHISARGLGWVSIIVRSEVTEGVGFRRITIHWPWGTERINFKILYGLPSSSGDGDCDQIQSAAYRQQ